LKDRVKVLKEAFEKEFDGYIVTNSVNLLYFTELLGAPDTLGAAVMLIPKKDESTLHIYGVNYEWAKAEAKNCKVEQIKKGEDLAKKLAEQVKRLKLKNLAFDTMSVQAHRKFSKALGKVGLEEKGEYVWNMRKVKDEEELRRMRKAAKLTEIGMKAAYDAIKAGLREIEVAAEIEYAMRTNGSYGLAFETSVASGSRSAYPHGGCGEHKLRRGDVVVVDIGARYRNYCADMTRTFVVGKPSVKQEKIYATVESAHEAAFQRIRKGAKAADVDAVARKVLEKAGYGKCFVHGLGHGIGLEVHEQPNLSSASKDVLKSGNVVTDEPGVYIVGFGGFRVEDTVLVRKSKAERLTDGLRVLKKS
jgi:Xaa-Pro aminopeptidase